MSKVMVAGYGSAGQYLVDFLMKDHRINMLDEICIISRAPEEKVEPRLNITRVAAGISLRYIPIKYRQCDFNNVDQLATMISEEDPDIIVYTGRYASGLKYGEFSYPYGIGYGVWMPMALPYIHNLMKARRQVHSKAKVINTSFPDGTNYLLGQLDLAPYCGAGNINHLIPRIKRATAKIHNCDVRHLDVRLVCAHYVNTYVSKEGTARGVGVSLLKVRDLYLQEDYCDDADEFADDVRKSSIFAECRDVSAGGPIRNQMIATDCAELVRLLLPVNRLLSDDTCVNTIIHVPGVKGAPGGQPCRVVMSSYDNSHELVSASMWDPSTTQSVNLRGLYNDGVEIVNGEMHFTDYVRDKMKECYDLDYPKTLTADDAKEFADEISRRLNTTAIGGGRKEIRK